MPKIKLDLDNARHQDQREIMEKIIADEQSPFLPANLPKYHPHPIIKQGQYWYVTKNNWPYRHTKHHYLIIANQYWTSLAQVPPHAMAEVLELAQWLEQEFAVPGGALAIRFGNSNYSGATVDHLHWQFIVPDPNAPDYEKVRFSIGKNITKLKKS